MDLENTKKWLLANNLFLDFVNYIEEAGFSVSDYQLTMRDDGGGVQLFGMAFTLQGDEGIVMPCVRAVTSSGFRRDGAVLPEPLNTIVTVAERVGCKVTGIMTDGARNESGDGWSGMKLGLGFGFGDIDAGLELYSDLEPQAESEDQKETIRLLEGLRAYYGGLPNEGGQTYADALDVAIAAVRGAGQGE